MRSTTTRGHKKIVLALSVFALAIAAVIALPACSNQQSSNTIEVTVKASSDVGDFATFEQTVSVPEGSSAYDATKAADLKVVASDSEYGKWIDSINGLATGDYGDLSGWVYSVNDEVALTASDKAEVANGDVVSWEYSH